MINRHLMSVWQRSKNPREAVFSHAAFAIQPILALIPRLGDHDRLPHAEGPCTGLTRASRNHRRRRVAMTHKRARLDARVKPVHDDAGPFDSHEPVSAGSGIAPIRSLALRNTLPPSSSVAR